MEYELASVLPINMAPVNSTSWAFNLTAEKLKDIKNIKLTKDFVK